MKITEQSLLDIEVRKQLIAQFNSADNKRRKDEAFKGYECLKDKTINYVIELLLKQFDSATVQEMQYATTNISILRKVIDKLAKVYANGVKRTMPVESETPAIEEMAEALGMNAKMKKANKYFRTFKNTVVYTRPYPADNGQYGIKVEALPPFHYDAIENPDCPEMPLAIVLSDYVPSRQTLYALGNPAQAGRGGPVGVVRDVVMDAPSIGAVDPHAEEKKEYIWWTKNYHFTTDAKGQIIAGELDLSNPILEMPFVNFAGEQDGQFWAEGGADLIDAGIKINTLVTNVNHVAISQGYGQMYMIGENLPKTVKVGPTHCIQLEYKKDENPVPSVGFLNSNPPINDLKGLVEMYVALMLSTNNLSTSGFSLNLQGGANFASGIALLIDKSESIEDVEEQSAIFVTNEPKIWGHIGKWQEVYSSKNLLTEEFQTIKMPKEPKEVQIEFPAHQPILSESEQLDILQRRMELGLNTMIEIIMRDNPALSEAEAKEKLKKILEEKMERMTQAVIPPGPESEDNENPEGVKPDDSEGNGSGGQPEPDDGNA